MPAFFTQQTEDLVQIVAAFQENERLSMAADHIPGSLFDAMRIAQRETRRQENAQDEEINRG